MATRELNPGVGIDSLQAQGDKAFRGACIIAAIARIAKDHSVVSEFDQWISVGAAIQNVLLAAESLGFHAIIVSGKKIRATCMHRAFHCAATEYLAGFVIVGTAPAHAACQRQADLSEMLSVWDGPIG